MAEQELAAQPEFAHVVVNDDLRRATGELYEIVAARARLRGPASRAAGRGARPLRLDSLQSPTRKGRPHNVISPRIDRLLEQVDSNYAGVIVAAKRARQINSYYHNLGEGTFDEFPPPMIETASKNYLTIALEEVAGGKMKYHYR